MASSFRTLWAGSIVTVLAANSPSISNTANATSAGSDGLQQAQEIGSKSPAASSNRPNSAKAPARKQMRRPDGAGNFVYELISTIRAESRELCARYGNPTDCLEEAEVCLTMRDNEDNQVKLCLNTIPGDSEGGEGTVQKSRVRR